MPSTDAVSDEALAQAALRAAGHDTIESVETLAAPLDGPGTIYSAKEATAWVVSPARARAEARGRDAGHPLAPRVLGSTDRVIVVPRLGPAPADAAAVLLASLGERAVTEARPLRAWLDTPDTRADRALEKLGLARRTIDRLLATTVEIETERGPSLGGLCPGWLRTDRATGTPIALSMHRAEESGFPALDLASLSILGGPDLREAHAARGDAGLRDRAFDVLTLRVLLRELVHARADVVADAIAIVQRFLPDAPRTVAVTIDAPPAVDLDRFAPLGDGVPASHARFLLRALDGLHLAGGVVRVRTRPELRPGRTRHAWEPRSVREARIDPRFDALRFDDEALFSATPRAVADVLVEHARGVVLDGTCGAGLLAIAAARRPEVREVVAVDVDRRRVAMAAHNASVHALEGRIRCVQGDVAALVAEIRPDTLILDPPWGGRDYDKRRTGFDDLALDVRPLFDAAPVVILKLPPSFDVAELPGGFDAKVLFDARAVPKCLAAVRR